MRLRSRQVASDFFFGNRNWKWNLIARSIVTFEMITHRDAGDGYLMHGIVDTFEYNQHTVQC